MIRILAVLTLLSAPVLAIDKPAAAEPTSPSADSFASPPYAADPGKLWRLTRNEEFSDNALSFNYLSPCSPWSRSLVDGSCGDSFNQGRERFSSSSVTVHDGIAQLVAAPMNPTAHSEACYSAIRSPTSTCDYSAGQLEGSPIPGSIGSYPRAADDYLWAFTYGYLEVKWKLPSNAPGFFPAFWMIDTDGQTPRDPSQRNYDYHWEMDMEVPGTPGWPGRGADHTSGWMASPVYMSYAYHNKFTDPGGGRDSGYRVNYGNTDAAKGFPVLSSRMNGDCPGGNFDYSTDWHKFAIDWGPTYVRWWIDRQLCGGYADPSGSTIAGPATKMFPIIWIGVDQGWNRSLSANLDSSCAADKSLTPCDLTGNSGAAESLLVDYVRLWQQTDP